MTGDILVWDLETAVDLQGYATAQNIPDATEADIRASIGETFPKLIYHSIICIGAIVAHRVPEGWDVQAAGAPHVGQRTEKQLIEAFVHKIAELSPQLVSFNGGSFDLPVLRYRAMIHSVSAPGMHQRSYYHRFTDDNVDLCDVLSSYSPSGKARLDEISRIMGLPGKPDGIDGSKVDEYFRAGRIQEISDYCKSDVLNTYRLWLRYELFRGKLDQTQFEYSEQNVSRFIGA
jgi:predicted PolB exonuclease-like 3'-5' exonuclease